MDRLTAARVFVTVVEQGSLTQAAEQLEMSTAMVSRYLAAIETWLGARLLHRTTRRVSLTDAGQSAIHSCRQLLGMAEEMEHVAGEGSQIPRGRLRIASSPSFAESQLAPALVEFRERYPEVSITLSATDRMVDLASERIDLAVRITNSLEPTLIARPLAVCRSVLCATPDYLNRHGRPATPDELPNHRCLTHAFATGAQFKFKHNEQMVEQPIKESFSTNDTSILRGLALSGAGLAILPTYYVAEDIRQGRLERLLPDFGLETLGIHALFLSRQYQPLALRLLLDFLVERFGGEIPFWDR